MACSTQYQNVVLTSIGSVLQVQTETQVQPDRTQIAVQTIINNDCPAPVGNATEVVCTPSTSYVTATQVIQGGTAYNVQTVTLYQTNRVTNRQAVATVCPTKATSVPSPTLHTTAAAQPITTSTSRASSTSFSTTVVVVTASDGSLSSSARLVPSLVPATADVSSSSNTSAIIGGVIGAFGGLILLLLIGLGLLKGKGPFAKCYKFRGDGTEGFDDFVWKPDAYDADEDEGEKTTGATNVVRQSTYSSKGDHRPISPADDQLMREHHRRISSSLGHHSDTDYPSTSLPDYTQSLPSYGHGQPAHLNLVSIPNPRFSVASSMYSNNMDDYRFSRRSSQMQQPGMPWRGHAPRRSNTTSLLPYIPAPGAPGIPPRQSVLQRQASAPLLNANNRPMSTYSTSNSQRGSLLVTNYNNSNTLVDPPSPTLTSADTSSACSSAGPLTPVLPSPGHQGSYYYKLGPVEESNEKLAETLEQDWVPKTGTLKVVNPIQEAHDKLEANSTRPVSTDFNSSASWVALMTSEH